MPEDEAPYVPASRPYRKRFRYQYRRHAFDKLRAIDLPLREFQALLDGGEVIAEAAVGILAHKDRPPHTVEEPSPRRDRR